MVTISTVYHACKVGHFPKIRSKSDLDAVPGVQRCAQGVFSGGLVFGWSFLLYLSEVDFFWITAHWIYDFFIMFRPLILEHFWDTRGTLWDMSRDTLGHVLEHLGTCLGTPAGHFGTCLGHFGTCLGTLWDMSRDMSQKCSIFWPDFRNAWIWNGGWTKILFFQYIDTIEHSWAIWTRRNSYRAIWIFELVRRQLDDFKVHLHVSENRFEESSKQLRQYKPSVPGSKSFLH